MLNRWKTYADKTGIYNNLFGSWHFTISPFEVMVTESLTGQNGMECIPEWNGMEWNGME